MAYANTPMTRITEGDYETLVVHLGEQLAALMPGSPEGEAGKAATEALANTWQATMTANEWLAAAGKRLGLDTSGCAGKEG
jgi:hypothetical protein